MANKIEENEVNKITDILVVGNGLDLHCGLKSSFNDFMIFRLLNSNGSLNECEILKNIWYILLVNEYYPNLNSKQHPSDFCNFSNYQLWSNVEDYIYDFLNNKGYHKNKSRYYELINNIFYKKHMFFYSLICIFSTKFRKIYKKLKARISNIKSEYYSVEKMLFNELKNYEKDFSNYLKKELNNKKTIYCDKLCNILNNNNLIDNHGTREVFIFSFNYTFCFDKSILNENVINVHGKLDDNNIIIGIDKVNEKSNNNDDECNIFLKSNRRLSYNLGPLNLPQKNDINSVLFYGCSFGNQDLKYYYYIFKKYELDKGNIKFEFLYSKYGRTDVENSKIEEEYKRIVKKTIEYYLTKNKSECSFENLYNSGKIHFRII